MAYSTSHMYNLDMNLVSILQILLLLIGILASCQIFTNAIEHLGEKLNLGHQFTGSILAAVGTALPETILPLVAIFMAHGGQNAGGHDIAIGAIVGAPFMLSTLAFFLLGLSIFFHRKSRKSEFLEVDTKHLIRDLQFFLLIFIPAILLACINVNLQIKIFTAIFLWIIYSIYMVITYKSADKELGSESIDIPELYLEKLTKQSGLVITLVQVAIGLLGIIFFSHSFVNIVEASSKLIGISPLILSLIVSPIATELPEKVNSWIWSSQGKDTLAMGNLSGAMVFQATVPCMIGLMLTPWKLESNSNLCVILTISSVLIALASLYIYKKLHYRTLLLCGSLYFVYLFKAISLF